MLDELAAASSTSISVRILENSPDPGSPRSSQAEALPVTKVSAKHGPTIFYFKAVKLIYLNAALR
jgi:hypothetical protein